MANCRGTDKLVLAGNLISDWLDALEIGMDFAGELLAELFCDAVENLGWLLDFSAMVVKRVLGLPAYMTPFNTAMDPHRDRLRWCPPGKGVPGLKSGAGGGKPGAACRNLAVSGTGTSGS